MAVRINEGLDAKSWPAFMMFKNDSRIYSIRGVTDNVEGV